MIETKCDVSGRSSGLEAALRNNDFPRLTAVSAPSALISRLSLPLRVSSRFALDSLLTQRTGCKMLQLGTYRCPDCYNDISSATRAGHPQCFPYNPRVLILFRMHHDPRTPPYRAIRSATGRKSRPFAENDGPFCRAGSGGISFAGQPLPDAR